MQDRPPSPLASPAPAAPLSLDDLYRACIDSSPYGIRVAEPDGRIALFNRRLEQITGYCAQEIPDIATWLAKLYPEPAYRNLNTYLCGEFRRSAASNSHYLENHQVMLTRRDGQVRLCRTTITLMPSGAELAFIRDSREWWPTPDGGAPELPPFDDSFPRFDWVLGPSGRFVLLGFNHAAEQWAGGELRSHLACDVAELFQDPDAICADMQHCLTHRTPLRRKTGFRLRSRGEDAYASATFAYVPPRYVTLRLEDLTDLVRVEKKLEQSERKFFLLADLLPEGVFETDLGGRIRYINRSGAALLGIRPEGQRGTGRAFECFAASDRLRVEENFRKVIQGNDIGLNEYRLMRRDGSAVDVLLRSTPIVDRDRIVGLRGFMIDVTARNAVERALQASERKFALAMQSSPNGFAINRLSDGLYLEANRSESLMTGYSREELIGRSSLELNLWVDPEDRARFCRELVEKNTVSGFGAKLRRKSGEIREVLFFASLADIDGQRCVLSEIADITDLKQMESALRRSHAELDHRVQGRTAELTAANRKLEQQVRKRRTVESKLRLREKQLKRRGDDLAESNAALKVLLKKREEDQSEIEEKIAAHLKQMVLPHVRKLQRLKLPGRAAVHLGALESNLVEIASPFAKVLSENLYHLTPTEMQVALLIKIDKNTKDIAAELHLSPKTVEFHRYNIRRKLGIGKKRLNLRSFLKTMK